MKRLSYDAFQNRTYEETDGPKYCVCIELGMYEFGFAILNKTYRFCSLACFPIFHISNNKPGLFESIIPIFSDKLYTSQIAEDETDEN